MIPEQYAWIQPGAIGINAAGSTCLIESLPWRSDDVDDDTTTWMVRIRWRNFQGSVTERCDKLEDVEQIRNQPRACNSRKPKLLTMTTAPASTPTTKTNATITNSKTTTMATVIGRRKRDAESEDQDPAEPEQGEDECETNQKPKARRSFCGGEYYDNNSNNDIVAVDDKFHALFDQIHSWAEAVAAQQGGSDRAKLLELCHTSEFRNFDQAFQKLAPLFVVSATAVAPSAQEIPNVAGDEKGSSDATATRKKTTRTTMRAPESSPACRKVQSKNNNNNSIPEQYAWIRPGAVGMNASGTTCMIESLPRRLEQDDDEVDDDDDDTEIWMVTVRWRNFEGGSTERCDKLEDVEQIQNQPRARGRKPELLTYTTLSPRRLASTPLRALNNTAATPAQTTVPNRSNNFDLLQVYQSLVSAGFPEAEVRAAINAVGPPYGLQTLTQWIRDARTKAAKRKFLVPIELGTKIRKAFHGKTYEGTVVEKKDFIVVVEGGDNDGAYTSSFQYDRIEQGWGIQHEDGDTEDMEWHEVFQSRADRPTLPSRGRQLLFLELFSGRGVVAQSFCDQRWRIESIDNAPESNATIQADIQDLKLGHLPYVPDCIWLSIPCETYSNASGNCHRDKENLEKSEKAKQHNLLFTNVFKLLRNILKKSPHCVVLIENPVGRLHKMPLMQEMEEVLGLQRFKVNYCAFGRDEKKPTFLWTNHPESFWSLGQFTCEKRCQLVDNDSHVGTQQLRGSHDVSAIPQALADEVAALATAHFMLKQPSIRFSKAPTNTLS